MSKTHLIIPDPHAHWEHSNERANWLGNLIVDVKPDVIINLGDSADMASLSSYDRGKRHFHGRTYRRDIVSHLDFEERLWTPFRRQKRKTPRRIFLIGNHEQRIEKALDLSPELVGTIGLEDLELERNYDTVVKYDGLYPGNIVVDGICYSHYFISGVLGRPIGGNHQAYTLVSKKFRSCTQGHTHTLDYCRVPVADNRGLSGLVAGCYLDYRANWAGVTNDLWWRGVVVKRNVEDGTFDPEFISLEALRKEYNNR